MKASAACRARQRPARCQRLSSAAAVLLTSPDILSQQAGAARTDILGRSIQRATILDPGTTRFVANGAVDPVSGLTNTSGADGYVRDPFSSACGPGTTGFTTSQLPGPEHTTLRVASILTAVKLLNLYPAAECGPSATYQDSPSLYEHSNTFDTRADFNPNDKNQIFARFSYADDPQFIPGTVCGRCRRRCIPTGDPDCEVGPDGGGLHARLQPEHDQPGARRLCASAHDALRTGRHADGDSGDNTESPDIPQVAENGGLAELRTSPT